MGEIILCLINKISRLVQCVTVQQLGLLIFSMYKNEVCSFFKCITTEFVSFSQCIITRSVHFLNAQLRLFIFSMFN